MTDTRCPVESCRFGQWVRHVLWHHPALVVTLGLLVVNASGWLSVWYSLTPFDINVFDYVGPTDLLLLGLKEPHLPAASLAFLAPAYAVSRYSRRSDTTSRKSLCWGSLVPLIPTVIAFILFIHAINSYNGIHDKLSAPGDPTYVTLRSAPSQAVPLIVVQSTSRFLFVAPPSGSAAFDSKPSSRKIRAIPFSNIDHIVFGEVPFDDGPSPRLPGPR